MPNLIAPKAVVSSEVDRAIRCVVLFDIDGTLVTGPKKNRSAGVRAMDAASKQVAGQPSGFNGADYAGRTDPQIARMLLVDAGRDPSTQAIEELISRYVAALAREIETRPFRLLGEPREAVTALRRFGAVVGLGTGNVRRGACLKLTSAGIADLFDFESGGFGEDGQTRTELLENGARMLNPDRKLPVVIIGDTPYDVAGAKGMGAYCVGIPFGNYDCASLEAAGADSVIDQLDASIATVVRSIIG